LGSGFLALFCCLASTICQYRAGEQVDFARRVLLFHVLNAVATEAGSFRKEKKNSPRKIDLLACAVLANGARQATKERQKSTAQRKAVIL